MMDERHDEVKVNLVKIISGNSRKEGKSDYEGH